MTLKRLLPTLLTNCRKKTPNTGCPVKVPPGGAAFAIFTVVNFFPVSFSFFTVTTRAGPPTAARSLSNSCSVLISLAMALLRMRDTTHTAHSCEHGAEAVLLRLASRRRAAPGESVHFPALVFVAKFELDVLVDHGLELRVGALSQRLGGHALQPRSLRLLRGLRV